MQINRSVKYFYICSGWAAPYLHLHAMYSAAGQYRPILILYTDFSAKYEHTLNGKKMANFEKFDALHYVYLQTQTLQIPVNFAD